MQELEDIKKRIDLIEERNKKVEADKAWETSYFRIFSIAAITYIIASIALYFIGIKNYLLSAIIPTLGYILSAQSLPFIKKAWVKGFNSRKIF